MKGTERTHCKTSAPTDGAIDTSTFRNNKFIHIKTRNNYGTENFNDELSGSTVERPLGFAACQSKNHDGVKGYG